MGDVVDCSNAILRALLMFSCTFINFVLQQKIWTSQIQTSIGNALKIAVDLPYAELG